MELVMKLGGWWWLDWWLDRISGPYGIRLMKWLETYRCLTVHFSFVLYRLVAMESYTLTTASCNWHEFFVDICRWVMIAIWMDVRNKTYDGRTYHGHITDIIFVDGRTFMSVGTDIYNFCSTVLNIDCADKCSTHSLINQRESIILAEDVRVFFYRSLRQHVPFLY